MSPVPALIPNIRGRLDLMQFFKFPCNRAEPYRAPATEAVHGVRLLDVISVGMAHPLSDEVDRDSAALHQGVPTRMEESCEQARQDPQGTVDIHGQSEQYSRTWIAYAVWPSAEARETAFERGILQLHPAVGEMMTYVEEVLGEIPLAVTDGLIVPGDSESEIGD